MACVFVLADIGVHRALAFRTLPSGCTAVAGTLTTCATYAGGTILDLNYIPLEAVQSGAFRGLASVILLYAPVACPGVPGVAHMLATLLALR